MKEQEGVQGGNLGGAHSIAPWRQEVTRWHQSHDKPWVTDAKSRDAGAELSPRVDGLTVAQGSPSFPLPLSRSPT